MLRKLENNKKGQLTVGVIVILFVGVIVGIALLNPIANEQSKTTDKQTITNDSITYTGLSGDSQINTSLQFNITKEQDDWRSTSCPIVINGITNSTGTAYTETTDYVFTGAYGNLTFKNTAKVNASMASDNLTLINYTYCDTGYNKDASSRSIAGLWTLFGALIIAGFVTLGIRSWINQR
jgi:hypothetical protein